MHGRARKPPEVFTTRTLRSWVHEYQKYEAVPGARGRPSAVSNSQLEWARTRVKELQQSKKGAVSSSQLREVLNTAFQHTQLEHHHTPDVGEMGRFAMHTTLARFRELPRSEMSERPRARFKNIKSETTLRSLRIFKPSRILNIPTCDFSLTNSRLWT